jgi:enterochelin esterase-like enzyme
METVSISRARNRPSAYIKRAHRRAAGWLLVLCTFAGALEAGTPAVGSGWVTRRVEAPGVTFHTLNSDAAGTRVSFHLYTPEAYRLLEDQRFPVLYWLHGAGAGVSGIAPLARLFEAAITNGSIPPLLLVFVNGLQAGMYVDWMGAKVPLETVITHELIPFIDANWRTVAGRDGRLIDGFSMGGYGAARLGFRYPELFGTVSMLGAGPLQEQLTETPLASLLEQEVVLQRVYGGKQTNFASLSPRRYAAEHAHALAIGTRIRVVVGDQDELYAHNLAFHEYLTSLEIPHDWMVVAGAGHNPLAVLLALGERNWAFYDAALAKALD